MPTIQTRSVKLSCSQNQEIDQETYAALEPYVGKTYLLQYVEIDSDVGHTVATEDAYFQE